MAMTRRATGRVLAPLAALALATSACGGLDLARTETTASEQSEDEDIEDPQTTDEGTMGSDGDADPDTPDTGAETDESVEGGEGGEGGEGDDEATTPDTGAEQDDDGEATPDAGSSLETGEQDDDTSAGSNRATPEDVDLDLTQRHPGGTVLEVTGLRFEGNTILVDAEFINGATREIRINTSGGQSLRLQDDVGNTYNFVLPDDIQDHIRLDQGETIRGEFAFLGPVDPRAGELVVITNIYDPVSLPINADHLYDKTSSPEFALEGLELTW